MDSRDARIRVPVGSERAALEALSVAASRVIGQVSMRPLCTGLSSLNLLAYDAESGAEYVVRGDLYRGLADVRTDYAISARCARRGVTVPPEPIWVGEVDNLAISIRPYIEGPTYSEASGLSPDAYMIVGRQLALIHGIRSPSRRPWFYAGPLRRLSQGEYGPDPLLQEARRLLVEHLDGLSDHAWSSGLVHSDFRSDNWVLRRGRDEAVILDWEKSTLGPRYFDLGLALFHIVTGPDGHSAAHYFLSGHQQVLPVDLTDKQLLGFLVLAASTYFLVDADIFARETATPSMSELDQRHANYFREYCVPRYAKLVELYSSEELWPFCAAM